MDKKYKFIITLVVVVILALTFILFNKTETNSSSQSTDDAYVRADLTVIAPQISGIVTKVLVDDNQLIPKGASLFQIDDRELVAEVANAQADIESLQAQLIRQESLIEQAKAAVSASDASLRLAERNRQRFINLARDGSGTVQARQQAEAEYTIRRSDYQRDIAGLHSAEQQVKILIAGLDKAKAVKTDADLQLSYAHVTAPVAGTVAQRHVRVGAYAHTGEPQLTLVPLDKIYIEANFRETQLAHIQAGQYVDITVDALPGIHIQGHVESLGPASGVSFSLVPPHNASGNFTKIVQRLPVRIKLDSGQKDISKLRVGMSVTPVIHINKAKSESL